MPPPRSRPAARKAARWWPRPRRSASGCSTTWPGGARPSASRSSGSRPAGTGLLAAYDVVRETLDVATDELQVALPEARLAAETASLRASDEDVATLEELEQEAASLPEAAVAVRTGRRHDWRAVRRPAMAQPSPAAPDEGAAGPATVATEVVEDPTGADAPRRTAPAPTPQPMGADAERCRRRGAGRGTGRRRGRWRVRRHPAGAGRARARGPPIVVGQRHPGRRRVRARGGWRRRCRQPSRRIRRGASPRKRRPRPPSRPRSRACSPASAARARSPPMPRPPNRLPPSRLQPTPEQVPLAPRSPRS